ncbi:CPBP family intramembrane glutamic endopeptidase [Butyrivibrio sp. AE2032]|uniref:CPBP family intramembrane glutamic endopeptidase n=1 Tax=Butyrivibrio sp. AE2032 TaxID=1458463 RepID=UPI00054E9EB6|nr:CPBP family intramembrane glutamic endopeptidase [Butyrivibrio sp. AE2032]
MFFKEKRVSSSVIIFIICLIVHAAEVFFLRTDETVFAECFVNKVFGIVVLFVLLALLKMKWSDIGFKAARFLPDCLKGFLICAVFYTIGFGAEFIALAVQGNPGHMEFFVTGFSLTGDVNKQTGVLFVLMCIFFNIINVWMEEGLFRGFYITYLKEKIGPKGALFLAALLFGIWHLVTPLRSVIDGQMTIPEFAVMSIGYVVLSALMGIKWGMLYEQSGSVWIGLADHFFNNCVVTNLLHVVTETGVDENQIMRVLIGELTSFVAVVIYVRLKKAKVAKCALA